MLLLGRERGRLLKIELPLDNSFALFDCSPFGLLLLRVCSEFLPYLVFSWGLVHRLQYTLVS